jgi:hypothetical protein
LALLVNPAPHAKMVYIVHVEYMDYSDSRTPCKAVLISPNQ